MRAIPIEHIREGQILGETLYNVRLFPAMRAGATLHLSHRKWLEENGYRTVYIHEAWEVDEPDPVIEEDRFVKALRQIKDLFDETRKVIGLEAQNDPMKSRVLFTLRSSRDEHLEELAGWAQRTIGEIVHRRSRYWTRPIIKSQAHYGVQHALCTALLSLLICLELNLNAKQAHAVFMASILAELGNIVVPKEVLEKRGRLTEQEQRMIQAHCYSGYLQIRSCAELNHMVKIICLEHHERIDGSGYPKGLPGENINLLAKIVAVADAYEALTSDRTYRMAYMPHKALEILRGGAGRVYDEQVVEALGRVVVPYPVGTLVALRNGSVGLVHRIGDAVNMPYVRIVEGEGKGDEVQLGSSSGFQVTGIRHALHEALS